MNIIYLDKKYPKMTYGLKKNTAENANLNVPLISVCRTKTGLSQDNTESGVNELYRAVVQ